MSLDPLVVSSIGTTITRRDSEDDRLLEVEVLTMTSKALSIMSVSTARKHRPTSHGSLKLLRATSFWTVSLVSRHPLSSDF